MYLTLNQAAKEANKSPSTIHKAIKSGRLSVHSKDEGGYKIDPAELFRVFPKVNKANTKSEQKKTPENRDEYKGEYLELKHKLELTEKDLEHEKQKSKALETERNKWEEESQKWQQQAERLSLTYQPAERSSEDSGNTGQEQVEAIKDAFSGPVWITALIMLCLLVALIFAIIMRLN